MKKKRIIIFLLQAVLAVGIATYFYSYVQDQVKPTEVYVYSKSLSSSEPVSVAIKEIPSSAIQPGMIKVNEKKKSELENKFVNVDVQKGHFVYESQLAEEGEVDIFETMDLSKYRKVSLPISYVDGFGGDIKRGDKVDLIFVSEGEKESEDALTSSTSKFTYAKTFLQDVLVYNVVTGKGDKFLSHAEREKLQQEAGEEESESIAVEGSTDELAVITLAVTLDQAEEIEARRNAGIIAFAGRFDENESYETLGYILGDYQKIFSAPANAETDRAKGVN